MYDNRLFALGDGTVLDNCRPITRRYPRLHTYGHRMHVSFSRWYLIGDQWRLENCSQQTSVISVCTAMTTSLEVPTVDTRMKLKEEKE